MLKFELPIVRLLMTCQRITFILFLVKNDSDCRQIDDPLVEAFAYQNIFITHLSDKSKSGRDRDRVREFQYGTAAQSISFF